MLTKLLDKISPRRIKYVEHRRKKGWRGSLPFFSFYCPVHGRVENYKQGFKQLLYCPICAEEEDG